MTRRGKQNAGDSSMTQAQFREQIATLVLQLAQRPLDDTLDDWLNREYGPETPTYQALRKSCETGVAEGWLCQREGGGIRYGRVFKPADDLQGFSVDVVDMNDIAGPHHIHPLGEIDLIMPIDSGATFDERGAGWLVCPPGSAHRPTVRGGRALVLYLLPQGQITFSP
jgi:hypothetical protein